MGISNAFISGYCNNDIQQMVHSFGKPYVYLGYQCSLLLEYLAYVHGQHHVTQDITLVSAVQYA